MPEGDTLHRTAARLRPALEGRRLVGFRANRLRGDRPRPGDTVEGVEAVGKHLLMHFAGGLSLRTHMRMSGSWHLYRTGERWQRPAGQARVVVEVDGGWTAVGFNVPEVETFRRGVETTVVESLGPDLCGPEPDLGAVLDRLAAVPGGVEVADALLDQRVAAGIGNVYKSEVCFACRVDPTTPVGEIPPALRTRLYEVAHRMLRANLGGGARATRDGGLAVYGRPGRPCPRCGTPIKVRRQGPHARSTFWCPRCQIHPAAPRVDRYTDRESIHKTEG